EERIKRQMATVNRDNLFGDARLVYDMIAAEEGLSNVIGPLKPTTSTERKLEMAKARGERAREEDEERSWLSGVLQSPFMAADAITTAAGREGVRLLSGALG